MTEELLKAQKELRILRDEMYAEILSKTQAPVYVQPPKDFGPWPYGEGVWRKAICDVPRMHGAVIQAEESDTPPHYHIETELIIVTAGHLIVWVETARHDLTESSTLIIPAYTHHRVAICSTTEFSLLWFPSLVESP